MVMRSTDDQHIVYLHRVSAELARYFSILIFIFGIIGNVLNILVFSRQIFRKNPCAILFLNSSIANLIALFSGLTSRMLSGWAADLTNTDRFLCKFRAFILSMARAVAFWLILLAVVDRWLVSTRTVRLRQISSWRNALKATVLIIIISACVFSQILYCYEPNLIDAPLQCYGATLACRYVNDIFFIFYVILAPILLMFIFGIITIYNVHRTQTRLQPRIAIIPNTLNTVNRNRQTIQKKMDLRLLLMLLTQVSVLVILGLPLGVWKLYDTATSMVSTSNLQTSVEDFVYHVLTLLNFLANGMPFYIYTLTGGKLFRSELVKMYSLVKKRIFCR